MIGWTVLVVLLALIVAVLVIPVRIRIEGRADGAAIEQIEVRLWGMVIYRGPAAGPPTAEPIAEEPEHRSERPSSRKRRPGALLKLLLGAPGRRLLRRMRDSVTLSDGRAEIDLGFDDPADTGLAAALIYPAMSLWGSEAVHVTPRFNGSAFRVDGAVTLTSSLWRLSTPPVRFLAEPGALDAVRLAVIGVPISKAKTKAVRAAA